MAYMRHEQIDLVSLLVRRRLPVSVPRGPVTRDECKRRAVGKMHGIGRGKEEKVRPEAAPEGARRCAVARGRYGIVVGAGGQHGVCPVTERTHHRSDETMV